MEYSLFLDTNALLNLQAHAFKEHFYIAQKTLEEIEEIKSSARKDGEVKYKARKVAHLLDENEGMYTVIPYGNNVADVLSSMNLELTPDNIIIASASIVNSSTPVVVVTDDINCRFISKAIFGLKTKSANDLNIIKNIDEYKGFKDVTLTDDEMSEFYLDVTNNKFDCCTNEYLIIRKSDGEIVDYRKWDGEQYKALSYKQINTKFVGKVKPRNPEQVLAFDLLQDKATTIKVLGGAAGSGKDYLMITNALRLIEDGKYDKLMYVRNAVIVKDSEELGFLPGELDSKLKPFAMPLADHLGGETGLDMQIMAGSIELAHLGFMRGRDIKNTIVYVSEAENLTKEHMSMLISRIGEGSVIWVNGDYKQTDKSLFRMNNGLLSVVQMLAGNSKFGYVQLQKTERSETAALADLLD